MVNGWQIGGGVNMNITHAQLHFCPLCQHQRSAAFLADNGKQIIILPEEGPKSMGNPRQKPAVEWETGISMEVFPNPSNGPVYVVYEVPEGTQHAELRLLDLHGRTLQSMRIGDGPGVQEWSTNELAPGLYVTELLLEGLASKQAKVVVQR